MYGEWTNFSRGQPARCKPIFDHPRRKVRKRTLCNLSQWPAAYIQGLRGVLRGGIVIAPERDAFTVTRSLPHSHVTATLGTAPKIGLDRLLSPEDSRCRDLVLALIVARILEPCSKPATARALSLAGATSSLGVELWLGEVDEDELYAGLDWLHERQPAIETALAKRHLKSGTLVLHDVSSSYLEGRCCPLAKRRHSRDGRKGTLQMTYGLLCAPDGCPVAIAVVAGNTADPLTLASQIEKLKHRFTPERVALVGDRGMQRAPDARARPRPYSGRGRAQAPATVRGDHHRPRRRRGDRQAQDGEASRAQHQRYHLPLRPKGSSAYEAYSSTPYRRDHPSVQFDRGVTAASEQDGEYREKQRPQSLVPRNARTFLLPAGMEELDHVLLEPVLPIVGVEALGGRGCPSKCREQKPPCPW
ncbi:MAG: IS1634 family transposase, partial [Acetobacteraceae bacterium]